MMRWFPLLAKRAPSPDEPSAAPEPAGRGAPYSPQYEIIVGQGHDHPTPFFSAPALVWHVGVWPKKRHDPHDNPPVAPDPAAPTLAREPIADRRKQTEAQWSIRNRAETSRRRHLAWVREIDTLLARMQQHRRPTPHAQPPKQFMRGDGSAPDAGSVVFTMWWRPPGSGANPDPGAIRVKVHCNLTPDYVTYSLYMDVATLWGGLGDAPTVPANPRRDAVRQAVADIRRVCHPRNGPQAAQGAPRRYAQVHQDDLSAADDATLLAARNLLYVDLWELFSTETRACLDDFAGTCGEVFANFRGVVLGVPDLGPHEPAQQRFPRFSEDPRFNRDGGQANAVVDAYWPFVRRIVPNADFREFVACGLLGWRALYVTALGSPAQYDENEERPPTLGEKSEADIRADAGRPERDSCVRIRYGSDELNHPVRYLMLTKEALNPRQLGRFVERINALGTLRLYALKDWSRIGEADATIRILGQELDEITRKWSDMRNLLERYPSMGHFQKLARRIGRYRRREWRRRYLTPWRAPRAEPPPDEMKLEAYLRTVDVPGRFRWLIIQAKTLLVGLGSLEIFRFVARENASRVIDIKYGVLSEISRELETSLIEIGAELDRQGIDVAGGLHFRVNRSGVHVQEFYNLLKLLQIGNIQTWTSYQQFVDRGLEPAFAYIRSVGTRIHALRERLIAVLETIETSALVGQSSATRHNTGELRRIMSYLLIFMGIYLAYQNWDGLLRKWTWVQSYLDQSAVVHAIEAFLDRLRR
ncbi:MAG: hypothetical protein NW223_17510 [Hyphomicrobiaceae bacterium]|nr:hypothetical protein [Hyphomicrobiaceae bacterium]